ncbi:MAG: endonuclease domain-containing protein [Nitrospira sp.]|nr:endonuclease domain-containing protein [Nitrospira sp.]
MTTVAASVPVLRWAATRARLDESVLAASVFSGDKRMLEGMDARFKTPLPLRSQCYRHSLGESEMDARFKAPLPSRERGWGEGSGRGVMEQRAFAKRLRRHMTESEHRLWRHLRAHRLNGQKFRRQQPIGPYVVDFVHFGVRLIVEADGGQHNAAPGDKQRDDWLREQGFTVLRFWNHEIMGNLEGVLATIMEAVANHPSPPAPLPPGERGAKSSRPNTVRTPPPPLPHGERGAAGPVHAGADAGAGRLAPRGEGMMTAAAKPLRETEAAVTNSKPLSLGGSGVARPTISDERLDSKPLSPGGRGVGERGDK